MVLEKPADDPSKKNIDAAATDNKTHGEDTATVKVGDSDTELKTGMELRLMQAIDALSKKIDYKTDEVKTEVKADVDSLKTQLSSMEKTLQTNTKKINDLTDSVNYAHKDVSDLKKRATQIEKENKRLKERFDVAEKGRKELEHTLQVFQANAWDRFNDLERHSRQFSIRVRNVENVKSTDNFRRVVAKTLIAEGLTDETEEKVVGEIEHAHPVGKSVGNKSTLIARLHNRPFRNNVLTKAKKKKFVAGAIRVVEDMTKVDHDRRQRAYPLMQAAHEDGKKTVFRRGRLYIDGNETIIPRT